MVDPFSVGVAVGILVKSAPKWFHTLQETLLSKGKDAAIAKGKERVQEFFDEKKHLRHMELALQNAAERGVKQWRTREERGYYRGVLEILSDTQSEALREEAMQLFTLSDNPNFTALTEKYNLSQRITALAHHKRHVEVDAGPYLQSFFEALLAELYNDPLFRGRMSDVIRVRAAVQGQRSLSDILSVLTNINDLLANNYSPERLQRDVDTYLEYIESKHRQHKFAGIVFRGDEDKAPELDGIFVPLRIVLQQQASPQDKDTDDLLVLLEHCPYLVLLGGPGSGKSTTTCHLAWSHAKVNLKASMSSAPAVKKSAVLPAKPVPLRIELRLLSEARRQNPEYSFLSYATKVMLGREDVVLPVQMFEALLERRAMFVLFDGLDEVPTLSERRQLVGEIETFAQRYPGNHILVTSRPVGYDIASFTDASFRHARIQDFSDEQIHQFLESWYTYVLKYSSLPFDIRQELETFYKTLLENPRLNRLAINPLLLTVMTALHRYERLPDERVLVYEKCADLLLDTWARLKHEGVRWKDMKMGKEDQKECMAHLGFVLHQRSQETEAKDVGERRHDTRSRADTAVDVPASFIRKEIKRFLADQNLLSGAEQHTEAERFLELVRTEAGLIVSRGTDEAGEPLYGFVHRTFQEYFAAVDVLNRYQQEDDSSIIHDFLKEQVHDPHWREVILLLFGKLKHRFATTQLRLILAGNTRRSSYTAIVKQDLFFVCACLADGITVEKDFAQEVVLAISKLARETPFPSQRREAVVALVALLRTRQYADLARLALPKLITENDASVPIQIQLAQAIYQSSPAGSEEEREGASLLITLFQQGDLSLEQQVQIAQALYEVSPEGSEEWREGARLLIARFQQGDLSLEQQVQIAQALYEVSPEGSEEMREGARLLIARFQQGDLSLEQQVQLAQAISQSSPEGSKEWREGARLLITLFQQGDLSLEQQIQLAQALNRFSPEGSEEWREGARLLIARFQQGDLSLEQQVQIAQALYEVSPEGSEEWREGARLLIARFQQGDLSLEQQVQIAQALYEVSPEGSEEMREGARLLIARFQQGDLSLEQQIQLAQAISQSSPARSEERREGARLLIARFQQGDLSLEQQIQLAQALNRFSPARSEERREGARLLIARFQQGDLSLEQQIQIAQALNRFSPARSEERREGARLLIALFQQGDLSLEQQIQIAQALYQSSPARSEEEQNAFRIFWQHVHNPDISMEQLLQLVTVPCERFRDNFSERAAAVRMLLTLIPREAAADILKKKWVQMPSYEQWLLDPIEQEIDVYSKYSADIPAIFELANQEVVPIDARDTMYGLLRDMVPLFERVDGVSQ